MGAANFKKKLFGKVSSEWTLSWASFTFSNYMYLLIKISEPTSKGYSLGSFGYSFGGGCWVNLGTLPGLSCCCLVPASFCEGCSECQTNQGLVK